MNRIGLWFLATSVGIVVLSLILTSFGLLESGPFGGDFVVCFLATVLTGGIGMILTFMGWIHRAFGSERIKASEKSELVFSARNEQAYGD
jgi:hypothetical protein